MTLSEIEEKLGYKIKLVSGKVGEVMNPYEITFRALLGTLFETWNMC